MLQKVIQNPNFAELENTILQKVYSKSIIQKYLSLNKQSNKIFSFLDGPITANNPMAVHHAWGRTYKDIWQRYYNLKGYKQRFQNGFDCQGLWVEVEVEKELGLKNKKDIENIIENNKEASIAKFVDMCKMRVQKYSSIQTQQSKRLGYFMDWDNSYFTMSPENNYMIWHFLKECHENKWIYKGKDAVAWCPRCETAISQHEMLTEDYKELTHQSLYLLFPITTEGYEDTYFIVWTTTPWTVAGNVALAISKDIEYVLIRLIAHNNKKFIIAKNRLDILFNKNEYKILNLIEHKTLFKLRYKGCFDTFDRVLKQTTNNHNYHSVIDGGEIVTSDEGTGILHVAPGQGGEDYQLGKKYNLPVIELIDESANYYDSMLELSFQNAKKHPELIIDYLKKFTNPPFLLKVVPYTHRYPACWRCKTELVWRVADEWYIAMDRKTIKNTSKHSSLTLRERMKKVAKAIQWIPDFGLERELDWLGNMHDWLISKKNRYWGLALPIFECKKCNTFEVVGSYQELKEKATSGWKEFEGKTPHKPWIDKVHIRCSKCNSEISRINDVGNPWLDAGIVPFSTISNINSSTPDYIKNKTAWNEWFPAEFITESFPGQFKNWFYALIAMSTVLENTAPFKTVLGFGTLLAEDGRAMHKSWGNAIEFNEGAEKIGADIIRWMYCRQNPADNMLFGYKKANDIKRSFYLILWNTYRYFIEYALLDQYIPKFYKDVLPDSKNILDIWILQEFMKLLHFITLQMDKYNCKDVSFKIEEFVSDMSTWYIRRSRDRVWINTENKDDKKSFYDTTYYILTHFSIVLSIFMPFISESMYTNLTNNESVYLETYPKIHKLQNLIGIDMKNIRKIVEVGHSMRKALKYKVRQPLSLATIAIPKSLKFKNSNHNLSYQNLIADELNVKKIKIKYVNSKNISVEYDTKLSQDLLDEGQARDIIRVIQDERKKLLLSPTQFVHVECEYPESKKEYIKKRVMAESIKKGNTLIITPV